MSVELQQKWYGDGGLLLWLETWLKMYRDETVKTYEIINGDLIPRRNYERAMAWCFHLFDVTVLTHQMVSMVYEKEESVDSVYYLDTVDLVEILKRLENGMNQCRDTFDELMTIDAIERMYVALAEENDIGNNDGRTAKRLEEELNSLTKRGDPRSAAGDAALPVGVSAYRPDPEQAGLMTDVLRSHGDVDQQLTEIATSLEILKAAGDRDAVRASNLESRLPSNTVRAIKLISAPGDAVLARQVCESYLAKLAETVEGVRTYRVDYGDLLSKWRGESEKNFEHIMTWLEDRARENASDGRRFDALWVDDVHALMSQRGGSAGGEDYLNVIKTTMLQKMDVFNKDSRLSRFALLFSTGAEPRDIDDAFKRRMDNVHELKPLGVSVAFREILVKHVLRVTRLNVEGAALVRLNGTATAGELQSAVYAYYVHAKFTVANEFNLARRGDQDYRLLPLKNYYNLKSDLVRTGGQNDTIVQAVENGDGPRYFYREGVVDGRNLPEEHAERAVFVLYDDPEMTSTKRDDENGRPPFASRRRVRHHHKRKPGADKSPVYPQHKKFVHAVGDGLLHGKSGKTAAPSRPAADVDETTVLADTSDEEY